MTDTTPPGKEWVNVTEAAEITGYHRAYVQQLVSRLWKKPEEEREIKMVKRSSGYEIWLPDLLEYKKKPMRGPQPKRKSPTP
ncbi:MAG TPA: hypothetical protein VHL11_05890 [Phototrophicaceae bacterium]|jgi:hypothetical protein|nr:hypothetical protein [Phototrophicaceae bacterium]